MVVTCGAREHGMSAEPGSTPQYSRSDRSGRAAVRSQRAALTPEVQGLWARVLARALVVVAVGVMALGFLGAEAALLVSGLTALTYVLLWLRSRYAGALFVTPDREGRGDPPDRPGPHPRRPRPPGPPRRRPQGPGWPPEPRRPPDEY